MKKTIIFLCIGLLCFMYSFAEATCFLAKEDNHVIKSEGDCGARHAPCSTFKIAISLMCYNEGLLVDETHPELPFREGYVDFLDNWKQAHTPRLWMKNSCVWYSQLLTQELGMDKFNEYVTKFSYGNQDISGDIGKDNGLTQSWLSSSLQISPEEQIQFLQKLIDIKLPVSIKSHEMTINILFVEYLADGWKFYGKTGNGYVPNQDGTLNEDRQGGWFIGWIQKDNHTITFAQYIQDEEKQDTPASMHAKAAAKEKLTEIIQSYTDGNS
ncbi:MAG: class D beta-lactamase [Pseudomonadota bacterium]